MRRQRIAALGLAGLIVAGCVAGQTAARSSRTIGSAVGEVTGTVIGRQHGQSSMGRSVGSKLGGVAGEMAGSTIESRRQTSHPDVATQLTKFCPTGGELYPNAFVFCPLHGTPLRPSAERPDPAQ